MHVDGSMMVCLMQQDGRHEDKLDNGQEGFMFTIGSSFSFLLLIASVGLLFTSSARTGA